MRVGLMFPPGRDQSDVVRLARRAEQLGFDYFCCGEHVFFHSPITNAFITLAAAAGATDRIRLLSALTILPAYPAALAAKLVSTVDNVSGGRFELGVGIGGEYPPELEAVGVPVAERGRRADEALDLMAELFTGAPVTFRGRFTTVIEQSLDPVPLQRPRPPIWVGGRRAAALRRAGRHADVWMPYLVEPDRLASTLAEVRMHAVEHGRKPDAVRGAIYCWSTVDPDPLRARQTAVTEVSALYRQDFSGLADRYLLFGDPRRVLRRLNEYADAGARDLVFAPACPADELDRMTDLFAAEVLPAVSEDV